MEREPLCDKHEEAIVAVFANENVPQCAIDLIKALLSDAEDIEADRDEAIEDANSLREQVEQRDSAQDEALVHVKYYLIDILSVIPRDPKKLLRIVENVL